MAASPHPPAPAGIMPDLQFAIVGAEALRFAAAPTVRLDLRVDASERWDVHSLLLDCQVRIAARRRQYRDPDEKRRLSDLFGPTEQWGKSLQGLLWANVPVFVPRFRGSTQTGLDLLCSYDFEVSAARYLAALADGAIPLDVLFSGTVVWADEGGRQRLARVPLDCEADFDLPVAVWRQAMDQHHPNAAWLRISRDRFARLQTYRAAAALASWDDVVDSLLAGRELAANGGGET